MIRWSVVIPYFNEAAGITPTLESAGAQTVPLSLYLVDNASTDGSEAVCRAVMARFPHVEVHYLHEGKPGQVHALKCGIDAADTEFTAIWDADTVYPPHYLKQAETMFDLNPGLVAAMAWLRAPVHGSRADRFAKFHWLTAAKLWPHQNHTSGPAQTYRTAALKAAGGYDPAIWPFVIKDHEIVNRVLKLGTQAYHPDLWCTSSDRRKNRTAVRWTLFERLVYHLHPARDRDWFFHRFLKRRFIARGQFDTKLRERAWEAPGSDRLAA